MRKYSGVVVSALFLGFFLSSNAFSQNRWGSDHLIGHFDEGISNTGPGYSNFDCLYGSDSDVFVGFIEHTTTPGTGDRSIVRKSFDNGLSWTRQSLFTGGTLPLFSPSICEVPWSGNIFSLCAVQQNADSTGMLGVVYDYTTLGTVVGLSNIDFSYPGADLIRYCFSVSNSTSGEIWVFAVDENNWLYLTKSSDAETWTQSVPVAANVVRPSAAVSADGSVAITWLHSVDNTVLCAVCDANGNFQPAVTVAENPASSASPVPVWEHAGNQNLGVVWHDGSGKSHLTISGDSGASWDDSELTENGIYPYISSFPSTSQVGVCLANSSSEVLVADAASLADVYQATFTARSTHDATLDGPSKTVFGGESNQLAIFFLTPDTKDFYCNNSVFNGINDQNSNSEVAVVVNHNPSSGFVTVTAANFNSPVEYRLYNLNGRLVDYSPAVTGSYTFNGTGLPAGLYTVTASGNNKTASCRFTLL